MVTTLDAELVGNLRTTIARAARRLRQEGESGLSPTLSAAMATILNHGPLTPSELADREHIQRPTATKLIARLEAEGLVTRSPDPDDRRSCRISVSDHGRAIVEAARGRRNEFLAERLETLSPEDRDTLARAAQLLEQLL